MLLQSLKLASRSVKSNGFYPSMLRNQAQRFLSTTRSTTTTTTSNLTTKFGLFVGASSAVLLHTHSKILNEAASNLGTIPVNNNQYTKVVDPQSINRPRTSRFNGALQYRQLSYGSLAGLFFGVVIGKLSSVLVFITLSAVLTLQVSIFNL